LIVSTAGGSPGFSPLIASLVSSPPSIVSAPVPPAMLVGTAVTDGAMVASSSRSPRVIWRILTVLLSQVAAFGPAALQPVIGVTGAVSVIVITIPERVTVTVLSSPGSAK
jgi:hypothetical protein